MEVSVEKFLVLIIVALLETVWGRVVVGEPRVPFQIRLPLSPHLTPFIVSASSINPLGFDFKKIYTHQPVKKVSSYAPIIPLVWVNNLPQFDTPSFKDDVQVTSESYKVPRFFKSNFSSAVPLERQEIKEFNVSNKQIIIGNLELPNLELPVQASTTESVALNKFNFTAQQPHANLNQILEQHKNKNTTNKPKLPEEYKNVNEIKTPADFKSSNATQIPLIIKLPDLNGNETDEFKSRHNDPVFAESKYQESRSSAQVAILPTEGSTDIPKYDFSYSVSDPETRDVKSHSESREGDTVTGEYSVLEPCYGAVCYTRIVTYIADAGGFRATVRRVAS